MTTEPPTKDTKFGLFDFPPFVTFVSSMAKAVSPFSPAISHLALSI